MKKLGVLVVGLVLLVAGTVWAHTSSQRARLTGANVVPGPGDEDGSGRALIKAAPEAETVCYKIYFSGIGRAKSAHIHEAPKGETGPKKFPLFSSEKGRRSPVEGCRHNLDPAEIEEMHQAPARHYVDIHTGGHPDGAVRGQLRPAED